MSSDPPRGIWFLLVLDQFVGGPRSNKEWDSHPLKLNIPMQFMLGSIAPRCRYYVLREIVPDIALLSYFVTIKELLSLFLIQWNIKSPKHWDLDHSWIQGLVKSYFLSKSIHMKNNYQTSCLKKQNKNTNLD